ncbi:MAG: AAA family ATPase [Fimbriimonadaceae bacterium]|nr:AAA family ATPase [Fimbriimonadaceae bacterium]
MRTIAFFNNKGGVGKTTLVYHLAWMMHLLGKRVLVADLDPQSNVTSMFLTDDEFDKLSEAGGQSTIFSALRPFLGGESGLGALEPWYAAEGLGLLLGDLSLSMAEDQFSETWPKCLDGDGRAFRVTTALHQLIHQAATTMQADLVLIDVGPNLGSLNRTALIAAQEVVVPLAPDLYSLQGLANLGPRLFVWREAWRKRLDSAPEDLNLSLPRGEMQPIGYVVLQHAMRADRPVQAYQRWLERIPTTFATKVLQQPESFPSPPVQDDPHCLAMLKNYRSLMPLAQDARKPMFLLKPADGALGSHTYAVEQCRKDFQALAEAILDRAARTLPL